jgi:hypothetical protein
MEEFSPIKYSIVWLTHIVPVNLTWLAYILHTSINMVNANSTHQILTKLEKDIKQTTGLEKAVDNLLKLQTLKLKHLQG